MTITGNVTVTGAPVSLSGTGVTPDTQIVATVASNATSGTAQVRQGGSWSNAVPFTVSTAMISTVTPASGVPGTQVTIVGSGFGAVQGAGGQVWLGTLSGVVQSWSDTQVVALVAPGAASGNAWILQNSVMSNALPFSVNSLHIISVSPASGLPGTSVTIIGTGFGSTQGTGTVMLGSTSGVNVSWSDTQVVATVAPTSLTGIVEVQQNGAVSNAKGFTVPVPGGNTLVPNAVTMIVGETRTLQALNAAGQPATGLTWTSSDPTKVSLSTDDPPVLTALAAGHVTITAGTATTAVTVVDAATLPGGTLPTGTVLWSNPGDGSGVTKIVPAVPSPTGVADVFAFQADGTVQAITSDGTTAWTADVSMAGDGGVLPDFQGGLVVQDGYSIWKLDGITGQRYPAYTPDGGFGWGLAVHTDGTIFATVAVEDQFAVVGIDPTTGSQKFLVPFIGVNQEIIIAGDGYAYVPYVYTPISMPDPPDPCTGQIGLLRIGSDGTYDDLWIANMTQDYSELCGFETPNIITNADKGVLLTWSYGPGNALVFGAAMVTGTSVSPIIPAPQIPGQEEEVVPVLQAQDGSFIGTTWISGGDFMQMCMVAFSETGQVLWAKPGYGPKIATADGGVIAQAYKSGESGGFFGPAVTFDQNGNATGQMDLPTYSWVWNAYRVGSVDQVVAAMAPFFATTFWAFQGGNMSYTPTAAQPLPDRVKAMYDGVNPGRTSVTRNITYSLYAGSNLYPPSKNAVIGEKLAYVSGQKPAPSSGPPGGQFDDEISTLGRGPFHITQQFVVKLPLTREYKVRIVPCIAFRKFGADIEQNDIYAADQTVSINNDGGSTEGRNCNAH